MRLVLLGPPGVGKGTQAVRLAQRLSIPHLSTGDMLRTAAAAGSPVGRAIAETMQRGGLVEDDLVVAAIVERICQADTVNGFILDGFPRTLSQAMTLDEILASKSLNLDLAIEFKADEAVLLQRILSRAKGAAESGQTVRADDTEEALKTRLHHFREQTEPLADYYRLNGLLRCIDGLQSIDAVTASLLEALVASA
jgi:adenylate kinase